MFENLNTPSLNLVDICHQLKSINTAQTNIGFCNMQSSQSERKHQIMELALEAADNLKISDLDQISIFTQSQCEELEDTWVESVLEQHAFLRDV